LSNPNYLQHLKLSFVFGRGAAAIPSIKLTMCDTYSTRRALMLALWFSFLTIQARFVPTSYDYSLRILPQVEKNEQVHEEGSTLTLTCIEEAISLLFLFTFLDNLTDQKLRTETDNPKWILPRSQVIKLISINYSISNVVTRTRVFSSMKMVG
jgi:hypothetical protein